MLHADRGVEYEFQVSAKNAIDFGTPAVAFIHTPEGGNTKLTAVSATATITINFHVTAVIIYKSSTL